jgi:hypothetical protein
LSNDYGTAIMTLSIKSYIILSFPCLTCIQVAWICMSDSMVALKSTISFSPIGL